MTKNATNFSASIPPCHKSVLCIRIIVNDLKGYIGPALKTQKRTPEIWAIAFIKVFCKHF